ncbi:hypothetical protein BKA70DRAFT_395054 [Coprinopsis sp. MPI-PUGE-AT-0042]|nr:hypothetical protein BKA70DRAFT_395054 [Coprinopsis sp. MPI-PUGE-AT-0042]
MVAGFVFCRTYTLSPKASFKESPPTLSSFHDEDAFGEGHVVTGGIDDCNPRMDDNQIEVDEITFQCNQSEGAILAMTSPADLHDMEQTYLLREYLCEHATQIFHFLREQHRLPSETSLYIVTGTTKSASWAIATHGQPMQPSHNSLVLKRIPRGERCSPLFRWTRMGNAQTEIRNHEHGQEKTQCLFLRGFLLTPSDNYLRGLKSGAKLKAPTEPSIPGPPPGKSHGKNPAHTGLGAECEGSATGTRTAAGNRLKLSQEASWDAKGSGDLAEVLVCSVPPQETPEYFPSFRINKAMLNHVSSSIH